MSLLGFTGIYWLQRPRIARGLQGYEPYVLLSHSPALFYIYGAMSGNRTPSNCLITNQVPSHSAQHGKIFGTSVSWCT